MLFTWLICCYFICHIYICVYGSLLLLSVHVYHLYVFCKERMRSIYCLCFCVVLLWSVCCVDVQRCVNERARLLAGAIPAVLTLPLSLSE